MPLLDIGGQASLPSLEPIVLTQLVLDVFKQGTEHDAAFLIKRLGDENIANILLDWDELSPTHLLRFFESSCEAVFRPEMLPHQVYIHDAIALSGCELISKNWLPTEDAILDVRYDDKSLQELIIVCYSGLISPGDAHQIFNSLHSESEIGISRDVIILFNQIPASLFSTTQLRGCINHSLRRFHERCAVGDLIEAESYLFFACYSHLKLRDLGERYFSKDLPRGAIKPSSEIPSLLRERVEQN